MPDITPKAGDPKSPEACAERLVAAIKLHQGGNKLNLAQAARDCDVTPVTLTSHAQGKTSMRVDTAAKYAAAFGGETAYYLSGQGEGPEALPPGGSGAEAAEAPEDRPDEIHRLMDEQTPGRIEPVPQTRLLGLADCRRNDQLYLDIEVPISRPGDSEPRDEWQIIRFRARGRACDVGQALREWVIMTDGLSIDIDNLPS